MDVGCRNGSMLEKLRLNGFKATGIDLNSKMIEIAKSKSLEVFEKNICDMDEKFDAVIAIADVLNYMDKKELKKFFFCVEKTLDKGDLFIADINTKHGFEDVAEGTMAKETDDQFLSVDALYDKSVLTTHITLFEKESDLYKKTAEQFCSIIILSEIKK